MVKGKKIRVSDIIMELLSDPVNDRVVTNLPRPPHKPMQIDVMIPPFSKFPSWELIKNHFIAEGVLSKPAAIFLISQATFIFQTEKNILYLTDPITIVGDIHGQYYDLIKLLEIGGSPIDTQYLFLGDYVDRGVFSVEVILLLFALKINYSKTIHLLRGNHESRNLTNFFNFRAEVLAKFDLEVYEMIMECFDCLPLACVLNKKLFCLHGGLSPELQTLKDIEKINRFIEPPRLGLYCDLLWADPINSISGLVPGSFKYNLNRSCSYYFGYQATKDFLKRNKLAMVIRAHEAQLEGYKMNRWEENSVLPMVITIFSAPNYCDTYKNKGGIIKIQDNIIDIQQYTSVPHPFYLPNFLNVFTWSVPFVIEKVLEIMGCALQSRADESEDLETSRENQKFIQNMLELSNLMRKNKPSDESVVISRISSPDSLETLHEKFLKAKTEDEINERCP